MSNHKYFDYINFEDGQKDKAIQTLIENNNGRTAFIHEGKNYFLHIREIEPIEKPKEYFDQLMTDEFKEDSKKLEKELFNGLYKDGFLIARREPHDFSTTRNAIYVFSDVKEFPKGFLQKAGKWTVYPATPNK
ncbi:hypothetical protein [Priestia megaterium]|uniref:hypothetical protein n=1 Tax=Priestia megaterium TaxID=1404 RepID=UPI0025A343B6|nr:hypothetical protein [Priestia megaterium]MDM8148514.1 hypothetical protein [Priestia megaterium]